MDPLPPDPYLALGLAKDVDSATIKSTYRKLVLKCHPDKVLVGVTDESIKKQKQEEFHKIQQAYELIGEDAARARYDAEVKLESLRKEKAARAASSGSPDVRTASYGVRMAAPATAAFKTNGPPRYEEHRPSRAYDDRYYEERSRKYDTYEAYPSKQSSSRSSREKGSPQKASPQKARESSRSDHKKSRDKERDRDRRHVASERERDSDPSGDEKARYEAEYKRRSEDARRRDEEDKARKEAADLRRKVEERRSYEDAKYDRKQKLSDQANDAVRYIHRSKVEGDRPSPGRAGSSRNFYDSRDDRSRRDRPEVVRRSSARPKDRHSPSRKGPEIVEWDSREDDRRAPSFKHSSSSPADIHVPRGPQRSYTESSRDQRRDVSPTPLFRRADTMSSVPQVSSSSRKAPTVSRRESATEAYPTIPPPSSTTRHYYYPTPGGGMTLSPEDVGVANGHRTVLREPERQRHRSPSPLTRPPMGANRPSEGSIRYTTATPSKSSMPPPPLGRSQTMNMADDRGRSRPLYGEISPDARRENSRRQSSFSPEEVSYSRKIGPEDVSWAPRSSNRDRDREYAKPTLGRHATFVY